MRMYFPNDLTDLNFDNVAVDQIQWIDNLGNPVDDRTSSLADGYVHYARMCRIADEKPMDYSDWAGLQPVTAEATDDPWKEIEALERENSRIYHENDRLKTELMQAKSKLQSVQDMSDSPYTFHELVAIREELMNENEELIAETDRKEAIIVELQSRPKGVGPTTPANQPLFPHYFREVTGVTHIDIYWLLKAWNVVNPCVQHAVKKLLVAGVRGAKNTEKDLTEARDSINRALELENVK